jgi:chemotaxis signal transduction protein
MNNHHPLTDHYCIFQAEDAIWAVAAASVREIADAAPIVVVPESPAEVVGVCHVRMEFVPVLSLSALLGDSGREYRTGDYLLILNSGEGPWALPVQRALSLQALEIAVGETVLGGHRQVSGILGTATFRDQVLRIIDAAWLYRRAHEVIESRWNRELTSVGDDAGLFAAEVNTSAHV